MKTALLVIDIQQALVDAHPAHSDAFLLNVDLLIHAAHDAGKEVIYVRHDGGAGDELEVNTPGWQLYRTLSPKPDEHIFEKRYASAFKETGLKDYLRSCDVRRLVICGMQTEYCIDTSIKAAFEHGFSVVVPSGATTTYANPFLSGERLVSYYENMIWHEPLAKVLPMDQALALLGE
jgi:nicotinamidase-related amidase